MEQVASGNIRGIIAAADRLTSKNNEYSAFAERVRTLAHDFQINQLSDLVGRVQAEQEGTHE
jgi:hypothetical protein